MDIRRLYRRWVRLGTPPEGLTARAAVMAVTPIPTCGACHRTLGPANEIRERVGDVVTACATCAVPTPLQGEVLDHGGESHGTAQSPDCSACVEAMEETGCNCWVRDRPAEERFAIRYGAHDVRCPTWVASLDPVDAANDAELRLRLDR